MHLIMKTALSDGYLTSFPVPQGGDRISLRKLVLSEYYISMAMGKVQLHCRGCGSSSSSSSSSSSNVSVAETIKYI